MARARRHTSAPTRTEIRCMRLAGETAGALRCYEIIFSNGNLSGDYSLFESNLFNNQNRFQGYMFDLEKLPSALKDISLNIQTNYLNIINGEPKIWETIQTLIDEDDKNKDHNNFIYSLESSNPGAREKADEAFRIKDYLKVVELLNPLDEILSKSYKAKLNYSKKKTKKNIFNFWR